MCIIFYTRVSAPCEGCQNPETWDFNGGKEFTNKVLDELITAINANNVERNLCIMGGEPLCPENEFLTNLLLLKLKKYIQILKYIYGLDMFMMI